jgi:hypothetical protein
MSLKLMSPVLSVIRIVIIRPIIMSKVIIGIVTVSKKISFNEIFTKS